MSNYIIENGLRLDGCLMPQNPVTAPTLEVKAPDSIPRQVDLRAMCSPVEDQGQVGSCAANAVVGAIEYHMKLKGEPVTDLSRLYVYYNSRQMAGNENEDTGTFIHHVCASVMAHGACPENLWPYVKAMWPMKPTQNCYEAGQYFTGVEYAQVPVNTTAAISAVAAGLPVVFGMLLPDDFVPNGGTGEYTFPGEWRPIRGGHAMLIVGYDLDSQSWLVRNSWGTSWGQAGHVRIPFAVMDHYAMPTQFWTIGAISSKSGMSLLGASQGEALQATRATAGADVSAALAMFKAGIAADLEQKLASAKQGFRDRLRGPGAGGGY